MNDAVGYYILCRVQEYLLYRRHKVVFDSDAYVLAQELKSQMIYEARGETFEAIGVIVDCETWKLNAYDNQDVEVAA